MAVNLDVIGKTLGPVPFKYNQDTAILYALGVGAGVDELDFIYEKNLKVLPTFAVAPLMEVIFVFVKESGFNLTSVLHGDQKIIVHKPIPTAGTLQTTGGCKEIRDMGDKGALAIVSYETRDENGELVFENIAGIWDRKAGNFGGDPGPKPEKIVPPEGIAPDFKVEFATSPDQAALYRLSGDKNPLHIDPEFAKMAGLDKPILHGLCTFGVAGRAIVNSVCGGDPARFKSLSARFTGMVWPGETLITEGWKAEEGKYIIRTQTGDGRMVLGNALAETA